jgi:TolB-like protein
LPLPDRPAIVVLPFTNMTGDAAQEYFFDGISDDIITAPSKLRWFFVIARNPSFIYKDKAVHMKKVAEELGIGYVVEGSVRKGDHRGDYRRDRAAALRRGKFSRPAQVARQHGMPGTW